MNCPPTPKMVSAGEGGVKVTDFELVEDVKAIAAN